MKTMVKVMLGVVLGVSVFMVLYKVIDVRGMLEKELNHITVSAEKDRIEKDLNENCDHDGWEIIETRDGEFKVRHNGKMDFRCRFVKAETIENLETSLNRGEIVVRVGE